jgi:hypothetical protein
MKPNTPDPVFTTEHMIALGGHFYSFSNLQDTVTGIIHCFAIDNLITNTEHPETRVLLFRMMEYLYKFFVRGADPQSEFPNFSKKCLTDSSIENNAQHLPDLMRFRSLIDVLALCNFCVLANVLDYNTYQFPLSKGGKPTARKVYLQDRYDYNALSPVKRRYYSYMCGVAFNFMNWLISEFDIVSTKESPDELNLSELLMDYLDNQAYGILNYKQKAELSSANRQYCQL